MYLKKCVTEEDLAEHFRKRYQVFCYEKKWEPLNPIGLEFDKFDFMDETSHYLIKDFGVIRTIQSNRTPYLVQSGEPHLEISRLILKSNSTSDKLLAIKEIFDLANDSLLTTVMLAEPRLARMVEKVLKIQVIKLRNASEKGNRHLYKIRG